MNKGLPAFIKDEYPYIIPAIEPEFKIPTKLKRNPFLLSGFITAEGSFFISLYSRLSRFPGLPPCQGKPGNE